MARGRKTARQQTLLSSYRLTKKQLENVVKRVKVSEKDSVRLPVKPTIVQTVESTKGRDKSRKRSKPIQNRLKETRRSISKSKSKPKDKKRVNKAQKKILDFYQSSMSPLKISFAEYPLSTQSSDALSEIPTNTTTHRKYSKPKASRKCRKMSTVTQKAVNLSTKAKSRSKTLQKSVKASTIKFKPNPSTLKLNGETDLNTKTQSFMVFRDKDIFKLTSSKYNMESCEVENDCDTDEDERTRQMKNSCRRIEFAIKKLIDE